MIKGYSFLHSIQISSGDHLVCYAVDADVSFLAVKLPEREAHHSPNNFVEVNTCGITPPILFTP
jgi:hypothetical protein